MIKIKIGASTEEFNKALAGVKTDLATLGGEVRKNEAAVLKWSAATVAASAAVGAAIINNSLQSAKELNNLARVANTSTSRFQALAAGARTVGIEQDKLADILKDVNDRVGDFITTGGGPMADFFERVAPKVGVTAEQFRKLSGPDALQLYVDSLQKANLSQQEMTFFMEAMASDATALIPLLRDGGAAMEEQADQAQRLGLVLSDIETQQMVEAQRAMSGAAEVAKGFANQMAAEFAPIISAVSNLLKEQAEAAGGVGEAASDSFGYIIDSAAFVADAVDGIGRVFTMAADTIIASWSTIAGTISEAILSILQTVNAVSFINLDAEIAEVERFAQQADGIAKEAWNNINNTLNQPLAGDSFKSFVRQAKEASAEAAQEAVNLTAMLNQGGEGGGLTSQKTEELREELAKRLEVIREANLTEREILLEKIAQENADLVAAKEQKLLTDAEYNDQLKRQQKRQQEDITALDKKQADARKKITDQEAAYKQQALGKALSNLSTLMNSESRKQFELGKAAALAQAVIDGYAAITGAYKVGASIGGPVVGGAFAAAAGAATFAQIQSIRNTQFQGGGTGGGAASVAATSGAAAVSNTQAINAQNEVIERQTSIDIALIGADSRDRAVAGGIIQQINDEIERGGRISRIGLA